VVHPLIQPTLDLNQPDDIGVVDYPVKKSPAELAYGQTIDVDPEHAAQVLGLAKKTSEHPAFIENNLEAAKREDAMPTSDYFATLEKKYPVTHAWVADPARMSVAKDDIDNLSMFEQAATEAVRASSKFAPGMLEKGLAEQTPMMANALNEGWRTEKAALQAGILQEQLHFLGYGKILGQNVDSGSFTGQVWNKIIGLGEGQNPDQRIADIQAQLQQLEAARPAVKGPLSALGRGIYGATEFVPWMTGEATRGAEYALGGAAVGALAGSETGPGALVPAVIGGMALYPVGAAEYNFKRMAGMMRISLDQVRDENGDPLPDNVKNIASLAAGAGGAGLGMIRLAAILKTIPGGEAFLKGFQSKAGEAILNPSTYKSALIDYTKQWVSSTTKAAGTMGALSALNIGLTSGAEGISGQPFPAFKMRQAIGEIASSIGEGALTFGVLGVPGTLLGLYSKMGEISRESKLAKRLPEAHQAFTESVINESPIQEIGIPANKFVTYFQEKNMDPMSVAKELGVDTQLQTALDSGTDVQIPYSRWMAKTVGTGHYDGLKEDIRFRPEDPTINETREQAETIGKEMEAEVKAAAKENPAWAEGRAAVLSDMTRQLIATEVYDQKTAGTQAELATKIIERLAARDKAASPAEWLRNNPIRIVNGQLEAQTPHVTPEAPAVEWVNAEVQKVKPPKVRRADIAAQAERLSLDAATIFEADRSQFDRWKEILKSGIAAPKEIGGQADVRDEYNQLPMWMKRKTGRGYDEIAQEARDAGLLGENEDIFVKLRELRAPKKAPKAEDFLDQARRDLEQQHYQTLLQSGIPIDDLFIVEKQNVAERFAQRMTEAKEQGLDDPAARKWALQKMSEGVQAAPRTTAGAQTEFGAGDIQGFGRGAKGEQELFQSSFRYVGEEPKFEPLAEKEVKALEKRVIAQFGTTENPNEAGYILSDGTMVDFSGKNQGGAGGKRELDHLAAGHALTDKQLKLIGHESGKDYFMHQTNAVRFSPNGNDWMVQSVWLPSDNQVRAIQDAVATGQPKSIYLETLGRGKNIYNPTPEDVALFYRGTTLFQGPAQEKNLVALHNLSSANLEHAEKMGGLAVPSLAIAKKEMPLEGFGEITLIGDSELVNPKRASTKVFNADIYSPRYPTIHYAHDLSVLKGMEPQLEKAKEYFKGDKEIVPSYASWHWSSIGDGEIDTRGREALANDRKVMAIFAMQNNAPKNIEFSLNYSKWFEAHKAEYAKFIDELAAKVITKEQIFNGFTDLGNRRYSPHTLDNVVKILRQELQGGEGFNYGLGSLRANVAKRYRTLTELQGDRSKAIGKEAFEKAKEITDKEFKEIVSEAYNHYSREATIGTGDRFIDAMVEGVKTHNIEGTLAEYGFTGMDTERIKAFLTTIRNMPTEYFEAKIQRAVQLDEFKGAVIPKKAPDFVREILAKHGIAYREYEGEKSRGAVVTKFSEELNQRLGTVLFQRDPIEDPRGFIRFTPKETLIAIVKGKADESTFPHELAHYWLKNFHEFVQAGRAEEGHRNDWNVLSQWLGVKEGQKEISREQQEKFAKGFEAFLREGKSPSDELRGVFAKFRRWMTRLYRDPGILGVELNENVRGVMARMIASEDEIAFAERDAGRDLSKEISIEGLDPALKGKLEKLREQAHDEAVNKLMRPQMAEISADNKAFLAKERDKATTDAEKILADNTELKAMDAVKAMFKKDPKTIAQSFVDGTMGAGDQDVFDVEAQRLGYLSADEMAKKILATNDRNTQTRAMVEQAMAKHADLRNRELIKEEAISAVHNEKAAELMALEESTFRLLVAEKQGQRYNAEQRARIARLEAMAAKIKAQETIGAKPVGVAGRFMPYFTAERNAALRVKKALAKGDYQTAADAKRQQLLNHALVSASYKAKHEIEKAMTLFDRFASRKQDLKNIPYGFIRQIDTLLADRGLADPRAEDAQTYLTIAKDMVANKAEPIDIAHATGWMLDADKKWKQETLPDLIDRIQNDYRTVEIPDSILAGEPRNYKAMPFRDFMDLKQTIKAINAVGRGYDNFLDETIRMTRKDAAAKFRAFVESEIGTKYRETRLAGAKPGENWFTKTGDVLMNLPDASIPSLVNFLSIADFLDGGKPDGMMKNLTYRLLLHGEENKSRMMEQAVKDVDGLLTKHFKPKEYEHLRKEMVYIKSYDRNFTRDELLAFALNYGTATGRQRLVDGYQLNGEQVREILSAVPKDHWDYAQDVWNYLNTYWPKIVAIQEKVAGETPKKVESLAVETPYGRYEGGYYPLFYDPAKSNETFRTIEARNALYKTGGPIVAHTEHGFTKARVTNFATPIRLDTRVMYDHLEDVIHDLNFRKAVIDVNGFLRQKDTREAIINAIGLPGFRAIENHLRWVASQQYQPLNGADRIIRKLRMGATVATLGLRPLQAPLSLGGNVLNAMHEIGPVRFASSIAEFMADRKTNTDFVNGLSMLMRDRLVVRDRDLADLARRWSATDSLFAHYTFFMDSAADQAISFPLWLNVYRGSLESLGKQKAIDLANEAVVKTMGSGRILDQANIQRGSESQKLFSWWYSWSGMMFNRAWRAGKFAGLEYDKGNVGTALAITANAALYGWILQSANENLWRELFRNVQNVDEDKRWKRVAMRSIMQPISYVPIYRDIAQGVLTKMVGQPSGGLTLPFQSAVETMTNPIADMAQSQINDKKLTPRFWENTGRVSAILFKYPQILNTWAFNFIDYLNDDGELTWKDLMSRRTKS
jgi:hypothetical protein